MLDLHKFTDQIKVSPFIAFFALSNTLSRTSDTAPTASEAFVVVIDHPCFAINQAVVVFAEDSMFHTIDETTASF